MTKRQFCQLAHVYNPKKHSIAGQYLSEKLDGQRAIWDGGVSRGMKKADVPYANTYKDERFKDKQIATGLWSRYGNVIHAPDDFLNALPNCPLDIELYAGRGKFQYVQSVVRDLVPGIGWRNIAALVLDSPPPEVWLADGVVNERNCKITFKDCHEWWCREWWYRLGSAFFCHNSLTFEQRLNYLRRILGSSGLPHVRLHNQIELPFNTEKAEELIEEQLDDIVANGGEGLVIKRRSALYTCDRSWDVLKVKPCNDAEAVVIGYYWGEEADNTRSVSGTATGKYLGKMGSLLVKWNGKQFKLSGFTDEERIIQWIPGERITLDSAESVGRSHPGELVPDCFYNPTFPRGSLVTFKYRELSNDGIPKEARYFRKP